SRRPFHILCIDGDLPEPGNPDSSCCCAHVLDLQVNLALFLGIRDDFPYGERLVHAHANNQ
ncbi:MAG: hypothetical protein WAO04_02115, partial [Candidatus Sulfotelmatobacter sp.]